MVQGIFEIEVFTVDFFGSVREFSCPFWIGEPKVVGVDDGLIPNGRICEVDVCEERICSIRNVSGAVVVACEINIRLRVIFIFLMLVSGTSTCDRVLRL